MAENGVIEWHNWTDCVPSNIILFFLCKLTAFLIFCALSISPVVIKSL